MPKPSATNWIVVILAVMLLGTFVVGACVVAGGFAFFFAAPSGPVPVPSVEVEMPASESTPKSERPVEVPDDPTLEGENE